MRTSTKITLFSFFLRAFAHATAGETSAENKIVAEYPSLVLDNSPAPTVDPNIVVVHAPTPEPEQPKDHTPLIIGLVIGITVFITFFAVGSYLLVRRRHRLQEAEAATLGDTEQMFAPEKPIDWDAASVRSLGGTLVGISKWRPGTAGSTISVVRPPNSRVASTLGPPVSIRSGNFERAHLVEVRRPSYQSSWTR